MNKYFIPATSVLFSIYAQASHVPDIDSPNRIVTIILDNGVRNVTVQERTDAELLYHFLTSKPITFPNQTAPTMHYVNAIPTDKK